MADQDTKRSTGLAALARHKVAVGIAAVAVAAAASSPVWWPAARDFFGQLFGATSASATGVEPDSHTIVDGPTFNETMAQLVTASGDATYLADPLDAITTITFHVGYGQPMSSAGDPMTNDEVRLISTEDDPSAAPSSRVPYQAWMTYQGTVIHVWTQVDDPDTTSVDESDFILNPYSDGLFAGLRNLTSFSAVDSFGTQIATSTVTYEHDTGSSILTIRRDTNCLDGTWFNTKWAEFMGSMFEECISLETLWLRQWSNEHAYDMHAMFSGCRSLKYLGLDRQPSSGPWNGASAATYATSAFVSSTRNASNRMDYVRRIDHMFADCYSLCNVVDARNGYEFYDPQGSVTGIPSYHVPNAPASLQYVWGDWNLSNWVVTGCTDMSYLFWNCHWLYYLNLGTWTGMRPIAVPAAVKTSGPRTQLNPVPSDVVSLSNTVNVSNMFGGAPLRALWLPSSPRVNIVLPSGTGTTPQLNHPLTCIDEDCDVFDIADLTNELVHKDQV